MIDIDIDESKLKAVAVIAKGVPLSHGISTETLKKRWSELVG